MKTRLFGTLLIAAILATPAVAQEVGVYESLDRIPIGRVFLSPEERARLDEFRGKGPSESVSPKPAGRTPARASNDDAAGFIVSDSGKTRVWKNGDFVPTASASDVRFPRYVRVASRPEAAEKADTDETDENDDAPVEVDDERE
ncbi:MAG: hypothetical protein QNJ11_06925 [Woeseiaceae bacterium]|nr:hypothetical protein [Woeseiaceae bacterium]